MISYQIKGKFTASVGGDPRSDNHVDPTFTAITATFPKVTIPFVSAVLFR